MIGIEEKVVKKKSCANFHAGGKIERQRNRYRGNGGGIIDILVPLQAQATINASSGFVYLAK